MNDTLVYSVPGAKGLREIFSVVKEIGAELGMYPEEIRLKDGRSVVYNKTDAGMLEKGDMSEEVYISKNQRDSMILG